MLPKADAPDRAQRKAAEYLAHVRKQIKRGELSAEPEVELEAREEASRQVRRSSGTKRARADDAAHVQMPKRRNMAQEAEEESEEESDASDASSSDDSDSDSHTSDGSEGENTTQDSDDSDASSSDNTSSDDASSDDSSEEEVIAPRNDRRTQKPAARPPPSKPSLADDEFFAM